MSENEHHVPPTPQKLNKPANQMTEDEWQKILPKEVFHVAREAGTEPPHSSKFVKHCATGKYNCFCCGAELFVSDSKFWSSCGWPAFSKSIDGDKNIVRIEDYSYGMERVEVRCKQIRLLLLATEPSRPMSNDVASSSFEDVLRTLCANNSKIVYADRRVVLITYEKRHVETYHSWMLDEETRAMTCSELLTLEEEYKTREQWAEHAYCGTFLIMDSQKFVDSKGSELDSLVGDVNFVQYVDYIELLIMIGDKSCRRLGLAQHAVCLMIAHISRFIGERVIQALVCPSNQACIALLQKVGFERQPSQLNPEDVLRLSAEKRLAVEKLVLECLVYENQTLIADLVQKSLTYCKSLQ